MRKLCGHISLEIYVRTMSALCPHNISFVRHISFARCCADIVRTYISRDICPHYIILRFSVLDICLGTYFFQGQPKNRDTFLLRQFFLGQIKKGDTFLELLFRKNCPEKKVSRFLCREKDVLKNFVNPLQAPSLELSWLESPKLS